MSFRQTSFKRSHGDHGADNVPDDITGAFPTDIDAYIAECEIKRKQYTAAALEATQPRMPLTARQHPEGHVDQRTPAVAKPRRAADIAARLFSEKQITGDENHDNTICV